MPDRSFRSGHHLQASESLHDHQQHSSSPWDVHIPPQPYSPPTQKCVRAHQSSRNDKDVPANTPENPHRNDKQSVQQSQQHPSRLRLSNPRQVVPGLPRPTTFKRQLSEQRQNLEPNRLTRSPSNSSRRRRTWSSIKRAASMAAFPARLSAPNLRSTSSSVPPAHASPTARQHSPSYVQQGTAQPVPAGRFINGEEDGCVSDDLSSRHSDASDEDEDLSDRDSFSDGIADPVLRDELESRWILNLSMAFRDRSDREKFFITFAERPNQWRRVTVSCNYAGAAPDSLEAALKSLHFPRDKSAHIYEAIRDSLANVQFYDTVTNLKLETADGRLHVHVTEDLNEIIKYPSIPAIGHLGFSGAELIPESQISFMSHLSGFVYKVDVHGHTYIKKEIPGPDMVEEFLYEVNALKKLRGAREVIDLFAIVVDDSRTRIKGLLISYADRGTLVDLIYDHKEEPLSWDRRDKWARQIVSGLSAIHEAGYVQGDFTLSNIVIDEHDDARIIDINRRGCPMGWEPPEFLGLIESGERISMYIGVKSDLFQLGMVLWAIAALDDEPERHQRTLQVDTDKTGAPEYLKEWVDLCLKDDPSERWSAKDLLEKPLESIAQVRDYPPPTTVSHPHAQMGDEVKGMNSLELNDDIPMEIPDTLFLDVSKSGHDSSEPNTVQNRSHASRSITGADFYDVEPEMIEDGQDAPFQRHYPANRMPPGGRRGSERRIPSVPQFGHPLHQDSGLGMEEREQLDNLRSGQVPLTAMRRHFDPPHHQDSGFSELADPRTVPASFDEMDPACCEVATGARKSDPVGVGVHASDG